MRFTDTIHTGTVTFLGVSPPAKRSDGPGYLETQPCQQLTCDLEGLKGDRHHGLALRSGGRQKTVYARGTSIRNNRQWTAISGEELATIQHNLGLKETVEAAHIGFNTQIDGLGSITQLPPLTHLVFSPHSTFEAKRPEDVVWVVYAEVLPCEIAGSALAHRFQDPKLASAFPKASLGLRGCTGYVDKGGFIETDWYVHQLTPTYKD